MSKEKFWYTLSQFNRWSLWYGHLLFLITIFENIYIFKNILAYRVANSVKLTDYFFTRIEQASKPIVNSTFRKYFLCFVEYFYKIKNCERFCYQSNSVFFLITQDWEILLTLNSAYYRQSSPIEVSIMP